MVKRAAFIIIIVISVYMSNMPNINNNTIRNTDTIPINVHRLASSEFIDYIYTVRIYKVL